MYKHHSNAFPRRRTKGQFQKQKKEIWSLNVNRISMTLLLLNQVRHIVFLITGKEKPRTVQAVLEDHKIRLPAQKIRPRNGQLTWLLDRGAASLLSGDLQHDKVNG